MKSIRYSIRLALVIMLLAGCSSGPIGDDEPIIRPDPSWDVYRINISFKEKDGNDLLKQFAYYKSDPTNPKYLGEVDPAMYTLRIVSSYNYPLDRYDFTMAKFDELHSWVRTDKNGVYENRGTWYFSNDFVIKTKNDGSPYSPLSYWICCETLFGTIVVQELVTWWKEGTVDKDSGLRYPECVKAKLGGVELKPIKGLTYNNKGELYYVGYFMDFIIEYNGRYGNVVYK